MVTLAFVALVAVGPQVALLARSLEGIRSGRALDVFATARTLRVVAVTAAQAGVSAGLALVAGTAAAWCHARLRFRGRRLLWAMSAAPFVLPSVVMAAGVKAWGVEGSWTAVVGTHVAMNVVVVMRTVGARLSAVDPHLVEAATSLGRSSWGAFRDVELPLIRSAAAGAALVVFLFSFTSFGVVMVLRGRGVTTIELEIWIEAVRRLRLDVATLLALGQVVVVAAVIGLQHRLSGRDVPSGAAGVRPSGGRRPPRGTGERAMVVASSAAAAAAALVPLAGLVVRSLRVEEAWSLANYASLLDPVVGTTGVASPLGAFGASARNALVATAIAMAVAVPASAVVARGGRLGSLVDQALFLPLAMSAAALGFGFFLAYRQPPLDLRSSALAIPLVEATIAVPLVVRLLVPRIRALDPRQAEAAAVLGASAWRRFRVAVARPLRDVVATGTVLAFVVGFGEFGATSFLARSSTPTVPQLIATLTARPRADAIGTAMALGVVVALLVTALFAALDRREGHGAFRF
jgi:thiamine transport system permease protein